MWTTELTATFHPTVVKFIFRFELLAKKKNHTFVTTALAPAFSPKAYQRQPSLFLFSSAFWLFTSHETGDEREIMTSQAEFLGDSSDRGSL